MRKSLQLLSIFFVAFLYGQQISDYQYILIPQKFKDSKTNRFGLNDLLTSKLKAKNYIVFNETLEQQPEQIINRCEILKAEVSDASNFLTNKSRVTFRDCEDKVVATFDGKSNIKDFEPGMREALQSALKNLSPSTQLKNVIAIQKELEPEIIQKVEIKKQIQPLVSQKEDVAPTPSITETKTADKAEVYTNGTLILNKILLSNGEFILVNPNDSIPYGIFKPSTKKDTFRVQMSDGTSTLGYLENGKIIVEKSNTDGSLKTEVFEKK